MPSLNTTDCSRHPVAFALVGLAIAAVGVFLTAQQGERTNYLGSMVLATGLLLFFRSLVNWNRQRRQRFQPPNPFPHDKGGSA